MSQTMKPLKPVDLTTPRPQLKRLTPGSLEESGPAGVGLTDADPIPAEDADDLDLTPAPKKDAEKPKK